MSQHHSDFFFCLQFLREREIDWLTDWTLFLNGEDISTKADLHICRCYNTTHNQDIHSEILLQKDIDK